ncbi:hypothetical protein EIP86_000412 [Pleurotus ostreatoroseus]|nr:hypothetical protein EIP86_000412 [Pleurotus ostreatoroseus]
MATRSAVARLAPALLRARPAPVARHVARRAAAVRAYATESEHSLRVLTDLIPRAMTLCCR